MTTTAAIGKNAAEGGNENVAAVAMGGNQAAAVKTLSKGARLLYRARQQEPGATQKRYSEMTGYQERHIRNLTRELREANLLETLSAPAAVTPPAPTGIEGLNAGQIAMADRLTAIGYTPVKAVRDTVQTYPLWLIDQGLAYVLGQGARISNPAGYLRVWLGFQAQNVAVVHDSAAPTPTSTPVNVPPVISQPTQPSLVETEPCPMPTAPTTSSAAQPVLPIPVQSSELAPLTQDNEFLILLYTVEGATGCDFTVNPTARYDVQRLYQAGYCAEDVGYFLKTYWPTIWPGRNGEPLTLDALLKHIGHAKHLLDMSVKSAAERRSSGDELLYRLAMIRQHQATGEPIHSLDDLHSANQNLPTSRLELDYHPYQKHPRLTSRLDSIADNLAAQEAEDQRLYEEDQAKRCSTCQRYLETCHCASKAAVPSRVKNVWQCVLDHLKIEFNRATYDTWLRRLDLIDYRVDEGGGCLSIEAPNEMTKDWFERHLMTAFVDKMNRSLPVHDAQRNQLVLRLELTVAPDEAL